MYRKEKFYKFKVMGEVKAKQSVKFARIGNFIRKYTPKDVTSYANWVRQSFIMQYEGHLPSELQVYYSTF